MKLKRTRKNNDKLDMNLDGMNIKKIYFHKILAKQTNNII